MSHGGTRDTGGGTFIAVAILVATAALFRSAASLLPRDGVSTPTAGTTVAFGFLLLTSFFAGRIAARVGLPRVTGYLVLGVVMGPSVLGLVTQPMVDSLGLVSGIAVCLIALTAGGELSVRRMRPLARVIGAMTVWGVLGTTVLLAVLFFVMRSMLPFLDGLPLPATLAVCALLAVTVASQSPAVVMALRTETQSDGPVSQTILGVVVVSDLVIIVLYAVASSVARSALGGGADPLGTVLLVTWELFGSLASGVILGIVLGVYLRKVKHGVALFVLLLCVVVAQVGKALHLDPLLVCLAAGMWIENVAEAEASEFIHELEGASLPIYVLFFAVAGAGLHLDAFWVVAIPAVVIALGRAGGFFAGCRVAAMRVGADPAVRRFAWFGLLPQSGLSLALGMLMQRAFPEFGAEAGALVLGVVGLNELVSPIFLRLALVRSGEAGQRAQATDAPAGLAATAPSPP